MIWVGVGVYDDALKPRVFQGLYRMHRAVVEFYALADAYGAGTQYHHFFAVALLDLVHRIVAGVVVGRLRLEFA